MPLIYFLQNKAVVTLSYLFARRIKSRFKAAQQPLALETTEMIADLSKETLGGFLNSHTDAVTFRV